MSNFSRLSRRDLLTLSAAGLAGLWGCGTTGLAPAPGFPRRPWSLRPEERALIAAESTTFQIVVRQVGGSSPLRRLARPVPPGIDLERVARRMERTMREAGGVGIAGPQVGLSLRVATLMLDAKTKHPRVVFVRNPVIVERSDETVDGYEGCLSIPGVGGLVRRHRWIKIQHTSRDGTVRSASADGFNAVLWQHEIDHLDGILYVDKLLGELLPMEEVRKRRRELERRRARPGVSVYLPSGSAADRLILL